MQFAFVSSKKLRCDVMMLFGMKYKKRRGPQKAKSSPPMSAWRMLSNQNPASARFGVASGPSDSPLSIVRACRLVAGGFAMEPRRDAAKAGDPRDCRHLRPGDE